VDPVGASERCGARGEQPPEAGVWLGRADLFVLLPVGDVAAGIPDGDPRLRPHQLRHVAATFDLGRFHRLVDLGGATGHFAIETCQRYPQLEAVVFDLPESMPLAQEIVGASQVGGRIVLAPGDFFRDPLPEGDLFALGRILHDWSEDKVLYLLGRVCERLPPGGGLLIAEKLLDDD
jgi:hypothetical protein